MTAPNPEIDPALPPEIVTALGIYGNACYHHRDAAMIEARRALDTIIGALVRERNSALTSMAAAIEDAERRGFEACREMAKEAINEGWLANAKKGFMNSDFYVIGTAESILEDIAALTQPTEQAEPQKPEA